MIICNHIQQAWQQSLVPRTIHVHAAMLDVDAYNVFIKIKTTGISYKDKLDCCEKIGLTYTNNIHVW